MFRSATAAIVVLAVTTVLAQGTSPDSAPAPRPIIKHWHSTNSATVMPPSAASRRTAAQTNAAMNKRLEDMEGTLTKMHALLKQMRAKAAKSSSKDPLAKANLDLWELMVAHLDKELQELRIATVTREDFEARRAAMYKQAEAKADAAAQAARNSSADQAPTTGPASQGAEQGTAGQPAAGQTSPAPPSNSAPPPN